MSQHVVYTRLHAHDIREQVASIPAMFAGRVPDRLGIVHGFKMRLAFAFLERVKESFLEKSRGGTDEAGDSWSPLTKEYLAYQRRFGPGEKAALKKAAGLGKGNRLAPGGQKGLLTARQLEEWQAIFARNMRWLEKLHGEKKAKGIAAAIAWKALKAQGARTMLEVFGTRQVDIGRDTGVMFNGLQPGLLAPSGADAAYTPPPNQKVEDRPGELAVGVTVAYAGAFHKRRPLWPSAEHVPSSWWRYFADHASAGMAFVAHLIGRGPM